MPVANILSISRQDLYDRVWASPVERVAEALGISDVGLAKACRRHQIPVPPRGYWRRKETGHRVRQIPLPKLSNDGTLTTVTFRSVQDARRPAPPEDLHPLIAFERDPANTVIVSDSIHATHPLVRATRTYWAALKRGEVNPGQHRLPFLNIRVSPAALPRALRLMHVLLTALDQRDFKTTATAEGKTVVTVLDIKLELSIRERLRQVRHEPTAKEREDMKRWSWATSPKFDQVHSGEFDLALENVWGTRHLWRDGKRQRLEQLLNDVIEGLIQAALQKQLREQEAKRRREAEAEAERRREAVRQQWREERARIRRLEQLMAASDRHERLGAFVDRLKSLAGSVNPESELGRWFQWARDYVQQIDPLRSWRQPQPLITLYHPVSRYELDSVLAKGFRDEPPERDDDQELPPSVLLGDVPLTRGYDSVCVMVTIPESVVLPFEAISEKRTYRRFLVPAAVIGHYGTVSRSDHS